MDLALFATFLLAFAGILGTTLGVFLLVVSSNRVHRLLGFILILEMGGWALVQAVFTLADEYGWLASRDLQALSAVSGMCWASAGPLFLLFGIYAIQWPPLHRFRNPWTVAAGFSASLALMAVEILVTRSVAYENAVGAEIVLVNLPDIVKAIVGLAIVGFVLGAMRHAQGLERKRAFAYLFAFGIRDFAWIGSTALLIAAGLSGNDLFEYDAAYRVALHGLFALFAIALSIAVLRGSILDLPRRLHAGINKTTLAAILIAVFVGVQTFVSEYFTDAIGLLGGAIAAGVLVLGFAPLEKMTRRLADVAVPEARQQFTEKEGLAFYQDQVRIAYSDGAVGAKERTALASIRQRLSISAEAAMLIEDKAAQHSLLDRLPRRATAETARAVGSR